MTDHCWLHQVKGPSKIKLIKFNLRLVQLILEDILPQIKHKERVSNI